MIHIDDIENAMGAMIGKSYRGISTLLQRNFKKSGVELNIDQWVILIGLFKKDGCKQQDLASFSRKDKGSITRIISGLEKRGLLLRKDDEADKRTKRVFLTKKGKEIQPELIKQVESTVETALKGQNEKDIAACRRVLRAVIMNTENALNTEE